MPLPADLLLVVDLRLVLDLRLRVDLPLQAVLRPRVVPLLRVAPAPPVAQRLELALPERLRREPVVPPQDLSPDLYLPLADPVPAAELARAKSVQMRVSRDK